MTLSARSAPPAPRPRLFVQVSRRADTRRPATPHESAAPSSPLAEIGRIPVAGDRSVSALVTMAFEFIHNFQPYFSVIFQKITILSNETDARIEVIKKYFLIAVV